MLGSNALGTVTPLTEMIKAAHRHGAKVLVDGAQAVSHMRADVQALNCDFYVLSGHKMFAPTGIGAVYGKSEILDVTPPWQGGGSMIQDVTFEKTVYSPPPAKFEAGTGNIADAVGLGAVIDYLDRVGMANITRYEAELLDLRHCRAAARPRAAHHWHGQGEGRRSLVRAGRRSHGGNGKSSQPRGYRGPFRAPLRPTDPSTLRTGTDGPGVAGALQHL